MNISKYKAKLASLDGKSPMPKIKDDPEAILDLKDLLDNLLRCMVTYPADYGIKWMMGLKRYLEDKKDSISHPFSGHLDRGQSVNYLGS